MPNETVPRIPDDDIRVVNRLSAIYDAVVPLVQMLELLELPAARTARRLRQEVAVELLARGRDRGEFR